MNPPPPSLNHHSFTFLPQNPNLLTPSSNLDLTAALSALKTLIHQSETAVASVHELLHHHHSRSDAYSSCPFDPRHRMPPEFLFQHHLRCPSSHSSPLDPSILQSLYYPKTLQFQTPNSLPQPIGDRNSELCFSLYQFGDFGSSFFYRDCPGVVELDRLHRALTLPGLLSVECANFVSAGDGGDGEIRGFSREWCSFLPSELLEVRREIELWNDYPGSYSYAVLRVVLFAEMINECEFLKWVIANSPCYGVVIDVAMRDHIFVLFKLVLKAIGREAVSLEVKGKGLDTNSKSMSFECPNLVQVMMWLASQLCVLYGEANGKSFSISMLKQYLLNAALNLVLFALEEKVTESPASKHVSRNVDVDGNDMKDVKLEPPQMSIEKDESVIGGERNNRKAISMSQVAAAVAALHERSLLEEKIRSSRVSQPLPKYQLMAEHAYVTARADEERKKRPNYRPLLEHDGLLWQRSRNQESSKTRTREELMAEERDYKRRRMSYRGKKLKQTTTQVMRDIIEEYMEEIKLAGGIGCSVKGAEERSVPPSELLAGQDTSTDINELQKMTYNSYESRGGPHDHRKQLQSDYEIRSTRFEDPSPKDYVQHRGVSHRHHGNLEDQKKSSSRDKHDREYYSRSSERSRSHGWSHEQTGYRSERDNVEFTRVKQQKLSSSMSRYRDNRPFSSASKHVNDHNMERDDKKTEVKDRLRRKAYGGHMSDSMVQNLFDDRYNPSESQDIFEDDVSSRSKYVKPDELYR